MYVITVEFIIKPAHLDAFLQRMHQQATDSISLETGCHYFDVCQDPEREERIFLYELYTDEAAFQTHLSSNHFKSFDADARNWVESKQVQVFNRL